MGGQDRPGTPLVRKGRQSYMHPPGRACPAPPGDTEGFIGQETVVDTGIAGQCDAQPGLEIVRIDPKDNLLLVRGSVPGPKNGVVEVRTHG